MSTANLKASKWSKTAPLSALDTIRIECGIDEDFRKKFIADPAGVLKSHGIDVPSDVKINVVQDTPGSYNISIPPFRGNDLSDASLKSAAANSNGTTWCTTCTATTPICAGSLASLTCA